MRMMKTATDMYSQLKLCPAGKRALDESAMYLGQQKCETLVDGLAEALPSCLFTKTNLISNYTQLIVTPLYTPQLLRLQLDPDATALSFDAINTWAELIPLLLEQKGVYWTSQPIEEAEEVEETQESE